MVEREAQRHERLVERLKQGKCYVRLRAPPILHPGEPDELLLRRQLWFSDVRSQDDIFEGSPRFAWRPLPVSFGDVLELTKRQLRNASASAIRKEAEAIFSKLQDPVRLGWMQIDIERAHEALYGSSSIASFFKSPFTQRNWADYAALGSGYALVFDGHETWRFVGSRGEPEADWLPFPVNYVDPAARPVIELSIGPADSRSAFSEVEGALLTKSVEWSHHQEERFIRVGISAGHVEFPTRALQAIVFGYAISGDLKERLKSLAQRSPCRLMLLDALPSQTHFGVELRPAS